MRIVTRLEMTEKHPVRITRVLQEKHMHPPFSDLYFIVNLLNNFKTCINVTCLSCKRVRETVAFNVDSENSSVHLLGCLGLNVSIYS